MKIIAYGDEKYSKKRKEMDLQVNPASLKCSQSISYSGTQAMGVSAKEKKFSAAGDSTLTFEAVFDSTGLIDLKEKSVSNAINHLESVVGYDGNSHQPHCLHVIWGSFSFKGRMSSLSCNYTLFTPEGEPLRAKVSMSITGSMDKMTEARQANRSSPDMTHVITLKAGENIAWWCNRIYGDASYCTDVARYNRLTGFRNVPPGTQLVFPPLIRAES
jgi:hypothetical protein